MEEFTADKRFYTLNQYLRQTFGEKVFKISLDGGFTCPNRDGTVAYGGCSFCSDVGAGEFIDRRCAPLEVQFHDFKEKMHQKWSCGKYIAYFQAFTNTHAPLAVLKERFEPILKEPGVVGIAIGTRPDCLPEDVLDYLAELNQRSHLWVELGLQTIHDDTALAFNRGYDFSVYLDSLNALEKRNIRVCTHMINGLPGESYEDMMQTAKTIAALPVWGVKIHLLHLLRGTALVPLHEAGKLNFLEREEYVRLVCDQLEILGPTVVVHRLTGDGPRDKIIGPMWSIKKWETLNAIDDLLEARDSWQGKFFGEGKV